MIAQSWIWQRSTIACSPCQTLRQHRPQGHANSNSNKPLKPRLRANLNTVCTLSGKTSDKSSKRIYGSTAVGLNSGSISITWGRLLFTCIMHGIKSFRLASPMSSTLNSKRNPFCKTSSPQSTSLRRPTRKATKMSHNRLNRYLLTVPRFIHLTQDWRSFKLDWPGIVNRNQ